MDETQRKTRTLSPREETFERLAAQRALLGMTWDELLIALLEAGGPELRRQRQKQLREAG